MTSQTLTRSRMSCGSEQSRSDCRRREAITGGEDLSPFEQSNCWWRGANASRGKQCQQSLVEGSCLTCMGAVSGEGERWLVGGSAVSVVGEQSQMQGSINLLVFLGSVSPECQLCTFYVTEFLPRSFPKFSHSNEAAPIHFLHCCWLADFACTQPRRGRFKNSLSGPATEL